MLLSSILKKVPLQYKHAIKAFLGQKSYYDWSNIRDLIEENSSEGLRVAFMTSSGAHRAGNLLEPAIAMSLKRRGLRSAVLLCDKVLPACNITEYGNQSSRLNVFLKGGPQATKSCDGCFRLGYNTWKNTGIQIYRFSQYCVGSHLTELPNDFSLDSELVYKGIDIREHVISASLRFLCRGSFDWDAAETKSVILRYLNAARDSVDIAQQFFDSYSPKVIICFHGIYIPHGIFGAVARSRGIRVVNWNTSYRKRRVLFSDDDTYHKAMCYEPEEKWNTRITQTQEKVILDYLESREDGKNDWQQFNDNPNKDVLSDTKLQTFLKSYPRCFLLLPNVIWDAQLQYDPSIYKSMGEWVIDSIRIFKNIKDAGLIIRIHPAEIRRFSPTREPLRSVIDSAFPDGVPANIHIIGAHEDHSTYRLSELSQAAIIYGTKTGLELAARGIPVIVCGEAWIKGKNISFDPSNVKEYEELLMSKSISMNSSMKERAIRFAYHFFERAALELSFLRSSKGDLVLEIDPSNAKAVSNGSDPVLERICSEIEKDTGLFIGGLSK